MLFDRRTLLKAALKPIQTRKEEIELMTTSEFVKHADEYREVVFRFNYLNSKQKALKVMMNTFYGELGNSLSPLRVLALAGGTTSSGQYNIKMIRDVVVSLGCRVYYGDTDSLYISMPRVDLEPFDKMYYSDQMTKREYYKALVEQSFLSIAKIKDAVNKYLEKDNGTKFLNMAFEEFLFPGAFFSKKKYCGIAHEGDFNEFPKHIFVRGLEYVKKGVSQILVDISLDILWKALSIENIEPLMDIVENKISEVYSGETIEFSKFIKTASYKPHKKNVSVRTFRDRMAAIGLAPEIPL
jgi:DNA polymerase elongation subunit (family B)